MTKTDMLFGGILVAVFTLLGMGFFTFASFSNPDSRASKRSEALLEASGPEEDPASSSSCGCYQLGYDLGNGGESATSLAYAGNYDLCYQRLSQSGARAFESGYLAGSGRIRSGRFCREGDFN